MYNDRLNVSATDNADAASYYDVIKNGCFDMGHIEGFANQWSQHFSGFSISISGFLLLISAFSISISDFLLSISAFSISIGGLLLSIRDFMASH
ncbi:hypothetical protein F3157_20570 [Virgibacillus dakarensis]|nr:hypothetical protein [Virgibacillus dakarensis]